MSDGARLDSPKSILTLVRKRLVISCQAAFATDRDMVGIDLGGVRAMQVHLRERAKSATAPALRSSRE